MLAAAFTAAGVKLRNESRIVGKIMLQDLLTDRFVSTALGFMRVATARSAGYRWSQLVFEMQMLRGSLAAEDEPTDEIERLIETASTEFKARWPTPESAGSVEDVVNFTMQTIGRNVLLAAVPSTARATGLIPSQLPWPLTLSIALKMRKRGKVRSITSRGSVLYH